jgi:Arm DNA-binding domain
LKNHEAIITRHHPGSASVTPHGINRVSTEANLRSNIVSFPSPKHPRSASKNIALTEQRIVDLKAAGSTIYVNDARMPGLSVRVTKAGVKSYVFTKKVNGRFLRLTLGKTASMTLSAARSAASAHHGDIAMPLCADLPRPLQA